MSIVLLALVGIGDKVAGEFGEEPAVDGPKAQDHPPRLLPSPFPYSQASISFWEGKSRSKALSPVHSLT